MGKTKWYDAHFLYSGFIKVEAASVDEAADIAEDILTAHIPEVESVVGTGVDVHMTDVLEEGRELSANRSDDICTLRLSKDEHNRLLELLDADADKALISRLKGIEWN